MLFFPFVAKQTNSSATYPYPFNYTWGPLLCLFMVTKDYYRMSSHIFPSLCALLDIFAQFVFDLYSKKMASAYIPFDEVIERGTSDVPGEVFSNFPTHQADFSFKF